MMDIDNFPLAIHNNRPFVFYKTVLDFDEFTQFVSGDPSFEIYDQMLDAMKRYSHGKCRGDCVIDKSEFRHAIAKYVAVKIRYLGKLVYTFKSHLVMDSMDESRHYYAYKLAKDFINLTGKEKFDLDFINSEYFKKGAILNYLNDLGLNMAHMYVSVMENNQTINEIDYVAKDRPVDPTLSRTIAHFFINYDTSSFFLAEVLTSKSTEYYVEDLMNMYDFGEKYTAGSK